MANGWRISKFSMFYGIGGFLTLMMGIAATDLEDVPLPPEILVAMGVLMITYAIIGLYP